MKKRDTEGLENEEQQQVVANVEDDNITDAETAHSNPIPIKVHPYINDDTAWGLPLMERRWKVKKLFQITYEIFHGLNLYAANLSIKVPATS